MVIKKIIIKNYKLLKDEKITLNPDINLFVGENDAGKSTILEALSILTTGKLNGYALDRQLKVNLFNTEIRNEFIKAIKNGERPEPPTIIFEAFLDGDAIYKGTQNSLSEDAVGINITVNISESNYSTYQKMLENDDIKDIPVELYSVSCHYFNGDSFSYRYSPFKSIIIDTGHKEYTNLVDHFISDSITENLSLAEQTDLSIAYKSSRRIFQENGVVKKLNETIKNNPTIQGRNV